MTGKEHTEHSQDLYFNHGKPTKNPKLVPYGAIKQNKKREVIKCPCIRQDDHFHQEDHLQKNPE